ncbi:MAG TPA: histidinol-phosphatase HisJ [Candidatus Lokiarchaeia archaeon]|nr:histidinol-phosphatase HisJ [Candidatus Lokiarchaeia archaeon]
MLPPDYHTHNQMCHHAEGTLEDYVQRAIAKGLPAIGFNDHFPQWYLPPGPPYEKYCMDQEELPVYFQTARQLREQYRDQVEIKIGMEVDFTIMDPDCSMILQPELSIWPFDYIYGSVHVITTLGEAWEVDDEIYLDHWDKGSNDLYYETYWRGIHAAIKTGLFDIIGHLDLPKKFGFVPEHPEQITPLIDEAISLLADYGIATELNTAGWYKPVGEQYPSFEILQKLAQAGVGMVLGSDAHDPAYVGRDFDRGLQLLKDAGFTELCDFTRGHCTRVPIDRFE